MPDAVQRTLALALLILAVPVIAALGLLVRLESPGPALYRAVRVGIDGQTFECLKLRTMRVAAAPGSRITAGTDHRITRIGGVLRKMRLDELPQLVNVVRGDMRLVGPRPEDPAFVDRANARQRVVLSVRPGITGLSQLAFGDESRWLVASDTEASYRAVVLPRKLILDEAYVRRRGFGLDAWILAATVRFALGRQPSADEITMRAGTARWQPGLGRQEDGDADGAELRPVE